MGDLAGNLAESCREPATPKHMERFDNKRILSEPNRAELRYGLVRSVAGAESDPGLAELPGSSLPLFLA